MTSQSKTPFAEFAETNGSYYEDVFLKIQKSILGPLHINNAALLGSFVWVALRANWTLFLIGFVIDLIALVSLSLYFKYVGAAIENADRAFLVYRYETWAHGHIIAALMVFAFGRILFSWLADRLYVKQYNKWRINRSTPGGFTISRLVMAGGIVALIVLLMIYRSSQFAPDERSCIRQDRAVAAG